MAIRTTCKICDQPLSKDVFLAERGINFDCPNCGAYTFDQAAYEDLDSYLERWPERASLLAHFVRKRADANRRPLISIDLVESAFSKDARFPNAFEQVENLVIWLAVHSPHPGRRHDIQYSSFQAIIGAADPEAFEWVTTETGKSGWIDGRSASTKTSPGAILGASLTLKGWEWYSRIGIQKRSRVAFMAMKFGDSTLDRVVEDFFTPAIAQTGFELRRLDHAPKAGLIDNRLRVEIRRSRFLICDLSHQNLGAHWEAGFAEGLDKPVFYTCDASMMDRPGHLHFDTRNNLIVPWDANLPDCAATELKAAIRNTLPDEAKLTDDYPHP